MQQQNLQKRYSQLLSLGQSPMGARDSQQKNVRLKQQPEALRVGNGQQPASLRNAQNTDSQNMLDYKDYNFIVGKKGQQALSGAQRYASQQPSGQDRNQYMELKQNAENEDLRRSSASGRKSSIMVRVEQDLNHDVSLGRGLGPAAKASEDQEHWSLAMVKDRSLPHTNSSAQRSVLRSTNDAASPLTTKGSYLSLSNKQPLKPLQRQGSKPGSLGTGQNDDAGQLYNVTEKTHCELSVMTIKIQEEMESKLASPAAPRTPAGNSPTVSTLNHT